MEMVFWTEQNVRIIVDGHISGVSARRGSTVYGISGHNTIFLLGNVCTYNMEISQSCPVLPNAVCNMQDGGGGVMGKILCYSVFSNVTA